MKKIYGLLGHPVGHSMSPLIHNDAFNVLGIDAAYHAFDVHPDQLKQAVDGIRALGLSGCNVTVPHKVAVMEYLDEVDEEARLIGAVNTIVNEDGKLKGYNTDGRGYVESLLEKAQSSLSNKRILLVGAGGAARGVLVALLKEGIAHVSITNRTLEKAKPLLAIANELKTDARLLSLEEAEALLNQYDVIINTTSVGMSPNISDTPLSINSLKTGVIVSDLIYNPLETHFLQEAGKQGAEIANGVAMFVNQAALSFEYWTGIRPDRKKMEQLVLRQLGGNETC